MLWSRWYLSGRGVSRSRNFWDGWRSSTLFGSGESMRLGRKAPCFATWRWSRRPSVRSVPATSPFAMIKGSDNQLVFTTARYKDNPLVITGPGAGAEVTAAGVLNDILRLAGA